MPNRRLTLMTNPIQRPRQRLLLAWLCALAACHTHAPSAPIGAALPPALEPAPLVLRAAEPEPLPGPEQADPPPWTSAFQVPGAPPRLVARRQVGQVWDAAFSSNGRMVAAFRASSPPEVVLWEVPSGAELQRFQVRNIDAVLGMSVEGFASGELIWGPGDRTIVLAQTGEVWDVARGTPTLEHRGPQGSSLTLGWSDDLALGLVASFPVWPESILAYAATTSVVETASGKPRWYKQLGNPLAISPDGSAVAAFERKPNDDAKQTVLILEGRTGARRAAIELEPPALHPPPLTSPSKGQSFSMPQAGRPTRAAFSSDGRVVALTTKGGLAVYDTSTGRLLAQAAYEGAIDRLRFVGDQRVYFASRDPYVVPPKTRHVRFDLASKQLTLLADDLADGARLERGHVRGAVAGAGAQRTFVDLDVATGARTVVGESSTKAAAVALGPQHALVQTLSAAGGLHPSLLDLKTGASRTLDAGSSFLMDLATTSSDRVLVRARGDDGKLHSLVFDLGVGQSLLDVASPASALLSPRAVLAEDGSWLHQDQMLSSVADPRVKRRLAGTVQAIGPDAAWVLTSDAYHAWTGDAYRTVNSPVPAPPLGAPLRPVAASLDGALVASTSGAEVTVWTSAEGKKLWTHTPLYDSSDAIAGITGLAFDPSGTRLAIKGSTHLTVVEARTGKQLQRTVLVGGSGLQWNGSGTQLLSCCAPAIVELQSPTGTAPTTDAWARLTQSVRSGGFLPEPGFLAAAHDDGSVRIWDVAQRREALRFLLFEGGRWLAVDPEGRFDTNDIERLDDVFWTAPDQPFTQLPIESYLRDYYQPGLARKILDRTPLEVVPDRSKLNTLLPKVTISEVHTAENGTLSVRVTVQDVRAARQGSELREGGGEEAKRRAAGAPEELRARPRDVRLFRGGQLVGRQPADLGGSAAVTFTNIAIPASTSSLELSAYAFNSDGVKSLTARKTVPVEAHDATHAPRAYVVNIGVDRYADPDFDLGFGVADATALGDALERALADTYDVRRVSLLGRERGEGAGTRDAARAVLRVLAGQTSASALSWLPEATQLAAATPEDLVLVSFAGHGLTSRTGRFHLLFGDYAGADLDTQTVGALDDGALAGEMAPIDAGELILIVDACQSAAAVDDGGFKPGPLGARGFGQLAYDKRMRVLAAAQANDVAIELGALGHGLLTYALAIDGLQKGSADFAPSDGAIGLGEWLRYGVRRVPELTLEAGSGRISARGLARMRLRQRAARATQEPRLFDFAGGDAKLMLRRTETK